MHDAGGEREALLPAAGELAGELRAARGEAEGGEGVADRGARVGQAVEAGDEVEVLLDGQVLVERELLGHVADPVLDGPALGAEVVAEHLALALVEGEQAAHHADRRGLARAVRAEEADDLAAVDGHRHVVDDGAAAEALGQVADVDDGVGHRGHSARADVDDLAGAQRPRVRPRSRLDAVDELLAVLDRVDHRRGELGLVGDVGDRRGQPVRAAVAAHRELGAGREAGDGGLADEDHELVGAVGEDGDHGVGRSGDLADAAEDVGDLAVDRRRERALVEVPAGVVDRGLGAGEPALGGGDELLARGQAFDGELGEELLDLGLGGVALGDGGVEVGLADDVAPRQRGLPLGLPLGLAEADLRGLERRLGDGDLLGAAALAQVGELGLGLGPRRLGLGEGDLGVGSLLAGDRLAGGHAVALAHRDLDELGRADRRELDVLALDVADREHVVGRAAQEAGEERQGAEKAGHGRCSRSASSRACRLAARVSATASTSAGPRVGQPMRR